MRLRTGDINQVVAETSRLFTHHKVKSFGAGTLDVWIFGRSSEELLLGGVSFPLSRTIRDLKERLGVVLFVCAPRRLQRRNCTCNPRESACICLGRETT